MRALSLFSGAGISDQGFQRAGIEIVGQVEIHRPSNRVRKLHFPNCEHFGDIRTFSGSKFKGVDIVVGGFPCQKYSVARTRNHVVGDKNALWWQFHRVVSETMPRVVVGENVPGLLSYGNGDELRIIANSLIELGYCVGWRTVDLFNFGIPHKRRRVFIVATLGNASCGRILFETENVCPIVGVDFGRESSNFPAVNGTVENNCEVFNIRQDRNQRGRSRLSITPLEAVTTLSSVMSGENSHKSQTIIVRNGQIRRLTPLEYERLMGLPDNYTAVGLNGKKISKSARFEMVGNGWSVPQAEWIARRIVKYAEV